MSRAHLIQDDGPRGRSVAEIVEQRDAALARVRTMLAEKPVTVHDVCVALGVARGNAYRLLKHLAVEDEAHPTRKFDAKRRELWAAGPGEDKRKGAAVTITTVRAEQVGVHRDELVAALFGPASVAVITTSPPCANFHPSTVWKKHEA
jgi:hypothetical protein